MNRTLTWFVCALAFLVGACSGSVPGSYPSSKSQGSYYTTISDATPATKWTPPATQPAPQGQVFRWKVPGGDKNKETVVQSLERFADKVPADVRQLLLQQYQTGQAIPTTPGYEGAVTHGVAYPGMRTVRMTFGRGAVVPNVYIDPADWNSPQWQRALKGVTMYQVTKKTPAHYQTYYIFVFEECNNVALVILDTQGDCIKDDLLCDVECQKVKAVVPVN